MTKPEVSVVIPLYNKERHIERTLGSISSQTWKDYEVIVIDDGSTDNSCKVAMKYIKDHHNERIKLIRQSNAGLPAARNAGIKRAGGDIIAFLDADDAWTSSFLEIIMRLKHHHPEAGLYATAFKFCGEDGSLRDIDLVAVPSSPWEGLLPNYFRSAALGDQLVCSSAVAIPKKVFDEIGGFAPWSPGSHDEDLEMWCRIALRYPMAYSTEIGAIYYRNADNRICRSIPEDLVMFKTAHEALKSNKVPEDMIRDLKEYIVKHQLLLAEQNYLCGNSHIARKLLSECRTFNFLSKKLWWSFWTRLPLGLYYLTYRIYKKLHLMGFKCK